MADLDVVRDDLMTRGLSQADLDPDPLRQVARWLEQATAWGVHEPEAMVLATADTEGRPSARLVLCRGFDERGFVLYTNGESRKAADLAARPHAALLFAWHVIGRQIRVEGGVEPVGDAEADAYFASRPRDSQIGAWASDQSRPLADRATLERRIAEVEARHAGGAVPRPPHWSGYRVVPDEVEVWQQRPFRLHDRFRYARQGDGWTVQRLYP